MGSETLQKASKLLEEARALVVSASKDAANRNAEFARRTSALEANMREVEEVLVRTEHQAARLANLYVATYQLHESLETTSVRAAVADIAVNLLGAESFTIWIRNEMGQLLRTPESSALNTASEQPAEYVGGDALLDAALDHLSPQFGPLEESGCLAAVPFVVRGEVVGVLTIERFLSHKQAITPDDFELLDLMAAHAASALLAARAFALAQRKLQTFEGLLGFLRRDVP
jgi:GAF domain-containing protein